MLQLEGVSRRFGGIVALDTVSMAVAEGEAVGLIGPNGSGKSTLFNVITGITPADGGRVTFAGRDISHDSPDAISRAGIARTVQSTRVFERLAVIDNVHPLMRGSRRDSSELLAALGLAHRREALAGTLSLAERRRLDIARALALQPRLLLLDEPAGALTAGEAEELTELIARVALPGRAAIIVEHKIDLIAALCSRVTVLHLGSKIAEGRPESIRADPMVQAVYFGAGRETRA